MMVILLLSFGAAYKLADSTGVNSFWPEITLALVQLAVLAASYSVRFIRRHFSAVSQAICYLTAGWFITLAAYNGFSPNYAVGLLFIIPGLGVGYAVASRHILPLALFFFLNVVATSVACYVTAGVGLASLLFIASLICISLVTMFVAMGWLDAHKRYLASEERYRAVVEQASDGIYMLDATTHTLLDANRAFCQMVGMTLTELRRMRIDDLVFPSQGLEPDARLNLSDSGVYLRARSHVAERMLKRSDGTLLFVELKMDRIAHEGGDILSVVVHDIQSRKEYEERLLRAKESAEEIAKFKSSLLANMSHEIRTPLCSILGWTAVLTDELPARQREIVRLIEHSGNRLHKTLDSVIELAQLQANTRRLRPRLVDLNEEVVAAAASLRKSAAEKGLDFVIESGPEDMWARIDPSCLRQILGHIIDNAIKFTEHGRVAVSVAKRSDDIAVCIEDTGVGIGGEFLPAIFDDFKQESEGLSRDHEGNGLGLAITRRLIDLIGGRIDVKSTRGVGTTFTVFVPAEHVMMQQTA